MDVPPPLAPLPPAEEDELPPDPLVPDPPVDFPAEEELLELVLVGELGATVFDFGWGNGTNGSRVAPPGW